MKYKYGSFDDSQFDEYRKRMHDLIHWLLIYAEEEKFDVLENYFTKVQYKLDGLNELLNHPPQMIEIMGLVESARLETLKESFNFRIYRKIILDIHELIDRISGGD